MVSKKLTFTKNARRKKNVSPINKQLPLSNKLLLVSGMDYYYFDIYSDISTKLVNYLK